MSAITPIDRNNRPERDATANPGVSDQEIIRVLGNSLYPGAKPESIALALSYCRMEGIDPMLKAIHIVPTRVKEGNDWVQRDILMPGIAAYRIKASRSGEYVGKAEPEFGPERDGWNGLKYPEWCRVTIYRFIHGEARPFTAKEFWLENYAEKGGKEQDASPNKMWRKRPYGQLAKCSESQALRMAFPEFSGGTNTSEEMEGRELYTTIDSATPAITRPLSSRIPASPAQLNHEAPDVSDLPTEARPRPKFDDWIQQVREEIVVCSSEEEIRAIASRDDVAGMLSGAVEKARNRFSVMIENAVLIANAKDQADLERVKSVARPIWTASDDTNLKKTIQYMLARKAEEFKAGDINAEA